MKFQLALYLVALATACFSASSYGWNTFGQERRQPILTTAYPFRTIGKLENDNGSCTATLVGRDLVLTASHCVTDASGNPVFGRFYPNAIRNQANTSSGVYKMWRGTSDPNANRQDDWAILQLYDALGDSYGWMGYKTADVDSVAMAGYSADLGGDTAYAEFGCNIRERFDSGSFLHDCSSTSGASGGPIFVFGDAGTTSETSAYIVGIHVASNHNGSPIGVHLDEYHRDYANWGVSATKFVDTLKSLKGE